MKEQGGTEEQPSMTTSDLDSFMVRGSPMLADLEFVRSRHGEEGEQRLLEAMPVSYSEICRQGISPRGWYSMAFRVSILDAINRLYAKDDPSYFWEIGNYQAKHNISNFYRMFVQVIGTDATLKLGKVYWRLIYASSRVELLSKPDRLEVEVFDYPKVSVHNCQVIRGYIHGTLELAGNPKHDLHGEEPTCINRGDERCRYVYTWENNRD